MNSYITSSKCILFQRTKNILLQDIINITYLMLEVNVLLHIVDDVKDLL